MLWLNIFSNNALLLGAEILVVIIGSMLLGIFISRFVNGNLKQKSAELAAALEEEQHKAVDLRAQVNEINQLRDEAQTQLDGLRQKENEKSKTIYDQQQYIFSCEAELKNQKTIVDGLHATIDSYQHRLAVIEKELEKVKSANKNPKKPASIPAVRANYEHVSQLLGRTVTENDLTLITGIGPKTAALLQSGGIKTWEKLGSTSKEALLKLLDKAGGIYKAHDPSSWPKQALMAARGEWRKLRIFQESLKKG